LLEPASHDPMERNPSINKKWKGLRGQDPDSDILVWDSVGHDTETLEVVVGSKCVRDHNNNT
jgi:hypothetical protein